MRCNLQTCLRGRLRGGWVKVSEELSFQSHHNEMHRPDLSFCVPTPTQPRLLSRVDFVNVALTASHPMGPLCASSRAEPASSLCPHVCILLPLRSLPAGQILPCGVKLITEKFSGKYEPESPTVRQRLSTFLLSQHT